MFPKQKNFYRGTKARTTNFQPASRGTFGSGLYFGDQACADEYAGPGGSVWEVKLNMSNPLHCLASLEHDYDLDSPAVPLIEQIFSIETAIELITGIRNFWLIKCQRCKEENLGIRNFWLIKCQRCKEENLSQRII